MRLLFASIWSAVLLLSYSCAQDLSDPLTARIRTMAVRFAALEERLRGFDIESVMTEVTALAAERDLLIWNFGERLEKNPEWSAIAACCKRLTGRAGDRMGSGPYFNVGAASVSHAILLEIAGEPKAALEHLTQVKAGGWCGNWHATVTLAVETRRAAILERQDDIAGALRATAKALGCLGFALHSKNEDMLHLRQARLVQRARERVRGLLLCPNPEEMLSLVQALGGLGDSALIPDLALVASRGDASARTAALDSLYQLGDQSQVNAYLEWLRGQAAVPAGASDLLRRIHGNLGPSPEEMDPTSPVGLAEAWIAWRRDHVGK